MEWVHLVKSRAMQTHMNVFNLINSLPSCHKLSIVQEDIEGITRFCYLNSRSFLLMATHAHYPFSTARIFWGTHSPHIVQVLRHPDNCNISPPWHRVELLHKLSPSESISTPHNYLEMELEKAMSSLEKRWKNVVLEAVLQQGRRKTTGREKQGQQIAYCYWSQVCPTFPIIGRIS